MNFKNDLNILNDVAFPRYYQTKAFFYMDD